MKEKRGTNLLVFCILSWVYIAYNLLQVGIGMAAGPMTDEDIRQVKITMLEDQPQEAIEMMGWFFEELVTILEITRDNFILMNSIELMTLLIGAIAVFLMFKLKKIGFHLYIIYSIIPIASTTYFMGGTKLGLLGVVVVTVISLAFVLMYGSQRSRLTE